MTGERRDFLKRVGKLTTAWAAGPVIGGMTPITSLLAGVLNRDKGGHASMHYAVLLDGVMAGFLKSAPTGGAAAADVVRESTGPDQHAKKQVGSPRYGAITIQFGPGMSRNFYEWIKAYISGGRALKTVSLLSLDSNYKETYRQECLSSLISEMTFPLLDAGSNLAAYLTVTFKPEYTRTTNAQHSAVSAPRGEGKTLMAGRFRLSISGMDCSRVNRIQALTVRQSAVESAVGAGRQAGIAHTSAFVSNLVVQIDAAHSDQFSRWQSQSSMNRNNGGEAKNGTLEFLGREAQPYFKLKLTELRMFSLSKVPSFPGQDRVLRMQAAMHCQSIGFSYTGAATA